MQTEKSKTLKFITILINIIVYIDDDSVKAEFAKKMIKYDMFSRTMSRWRDNARVR